MKYLFLYALGMLISSISAAQNMQRFNFAYQEKSMALAGAAPTTVNEVSGIPSFTDILGKNILLPQVEVSGFTNFSSGETFYGDIRMFTSASGSKNASNLNLFFPETSVYGISMSFNWLPFPEASFVDLGGSKNKWLCTYFNANYLGKNLLGVTKTDISSDTTRFTTDVAHLKLGVQIIPKINILSFYVDLNFLLPVVNRDPLLKFNPNIKMGSNNFWNIGTKFYLANGPDKPLKLYVDFSAIVADKVTRRVFDKSDSLIPRLAIGATAKF